MGIVKLEKSTKPLSFLIVLTDCSPNAYENPKKIGGSGVPVRQI